MHAKLLIAGVSSGAGKTTITMGLIAALRRRGLQIQPFKAGPDYIDPTYHSLAAGRPCRNIDTWMVPPDRAVAFFNKATQDVDVAVVEGVMGLFDGFSYRDEEGSSAQIAKLVQAPVFLVMDVGKMARSAGALALGYSRFDPELKIAGFILNRCGSPQHYEGVKLAVEQATALPVVGWLPKDAELHIPERHLGLVPTDERGELTAFINHAADVIEKHFDLDQILKISIPTPSMSHTPLLLQKGIVDYMPESPNLHSPVTIAVARDTAFSFYYEDNLDLLREAGASVVFFSPQTDNDLPPNVSGIYIGGGFPEIYAAQLATNLSLFEAIRGAFTAGMPIYAECGGFMYLTEAIIDLEGQPHSMVGLVPGVTHMQPRLMSLGYRVVQSPTGNFLLPKGVAIRGHEFHWSTWEAMSSQQLAVSDQQSAVSYQKPDASNEQALPPPEGRRREHASERRATISNYQLPISNLQSPISSFQPSPAWLIQPRHGNGDPQPNGYATDNLVASYVHLHFAHNPQLAHNFVQACRNWRARDAA